MLPLNSCKPKDGVCSLNDLLSTARLEIYLSAIGTYHRGYACQLNGYPFPLKVLRGISLFQLPAATFFIISFPSASASSTTVFAECRPFGKIAHYFRRGRVQSSQRIKKMGQPIWPYPMTSQTSTSPPFLHPIFPEAALKITSATSWGGRP